MKTLKEKGQLTHRHIVYMYEDVKEAVSDLKKFIKKNEIKDIEDEKYYDDTYISVSDLIEFIDLIEFGDFEK